MKTIANDRLTHAYLQRLDRYNYFATASAILLVIFSLLWMLFRVGGDRGTSYLGNGAFILAALFGAVMCFVTSHRARFGPLQLAQRYQQVWFFIGLGLVTITIGGAFYGYLLFSGNLTFPSIADLFFNLSYPLIFIGLLLIPTTTRFSLRIVLDAFITTLCCLGVFWLVLIGPAYFSIVAHSTTFPQMLRLIMLISYTCWDIVLILAILLLIQSHIEPALHFSLLLFVIGIAASTWADVSYAYTVVFMNAYHTGTPLIEPFWLISRLMMGLAGLYQYSSIARHTYKKLHVANGSAAPNQPVQLPRQQSRNLALRGWYYFQGLLIYVPLILLLVLMAYAEMTREHPVADGLTLITAITGTFVVLRYFLTTHENNALLREREQQRLEAERLHHMVTQLTELFEMDHLREHAVRLTTAELGFDAAMLIFVEDHNHPIDLRPQVSVTVTSMSVDATTWRFQGDNILYQVFHREKVTTIYWINHFSEMPQEIRAWQQDLSIPSMTFFPLIYQGRTLGSLGVAHRSDSMLSHGDESLLKNYAEQVATLVDHARLYQEAREHETFAKALANIATRLNEVVAEAVEIGQMICEEGARALRADYTLLYTRDPHNEGRLLPLCSYVNDADIAVSSASLPAVSATTPLATKISWPPIYLHEYEGQALHSLQPTLLYTTQWPTVQKRPVAPSMSDTQPLPGALLRESRRARVSSLRETLARSFVRTAILAPLIAHGEPVGILVFARAQVPGGRDRRAFDTQDLPQAQDFGEQAGVAFTNAQLYQSLSKAHERLKELDLMKDQFMVTASHELRTPLTAVQGYIELMAEYDEELPVEQRREFLQKARRGCDELAVLLGNVMDASRLEGEMGVKSALMRRVSVQEIIDSVVILIEPHLTKEQRELHMIIPSHLAVYADPVRLRQVLMNICTNALKYSPPGTPISIQARTAGPGVLISIADKGKGVKKEDQEHIFQRFFRVESDLNSPVRGSGLGLYISHRLIAAMGGKIWIDSKGIPGEGSTFHIQLSIAN